MKPLCYLLFLLLAGVLRSADVAPKTILFFGDSLSAGYGLDDPATQAFPGLIQKKITAANLPYLVVNAGLSGETTAGGLRRIDWVLRMPIDVFVLELGGNDGLRGLAPSLAAKNLQAIIDKVRAKNPATKIVITGMQMPVNMGVAYTGEFSGLFPTLAKTNNATLVPFLLEGVGGVPELNLPDGVHPNAQGHQIVAETLWKTLEPLLKGSPATSAPPNGARVE
jgi:acyl-CoA thioesterase-1